MIILLVVAAADNATAFDPHTPRTSSADRNIET
jgi:hypothetical protein